MRLKSGILTVVTFIIAAVFALTVIAQDDTTDKGKADTKKNADKQGMCWELSNKTMQMAKK